MELLIGLIAIIAVGVLIYFNRSSKGLDINQDGKIDAQDVTQAVDNAVQGVKQETAKAKQQVKKAVAKTTAKTSTRKSTGTRSTGARRTPKK